MLNKRQWTSATSSSPERSPIWSPSRCCSKRATAASQRINEQLSGTLSSRIVIERAKGVISERAGVDLADAFTRLRSYARNHNLLLSAVGQAAVDGSLGPSAWRPVDPSIRS